VLFGESLGDPDDGDCLQPRQREIRDGETGDHRPEGPAGQDEGEDKPNLARGTEAEEKKKAISEADLGEGVIEGPVGLGRMSGAKKDAEQDQDERAPKSMSDHGGRRLAFGQPAGHRER